MIRENEREQFELLTRIGVLGPYEQGQWMPASSKIFQGRIFQMGARKSSIKGACQG